MGELIQSVKTGLESTLSGTVISWNSLYGIVMILIIVFLVYKGIHRIGKLIWSLVSFILLVEICHIVVVYTDVGQAVPFLQTIFKHSVFTALAQLCVGTPVSQGLLWAESALVSLCLKVISAIQPAFTGVTGMLHG